MPLLALAFFLLIWVKIDYDGRKENQRFFTNKKEVFNPQLSLFND